MTRLTQKTFALETTPGSGSGNQRYAQQKAKTPDAAMLRKGKAISQCINGDCAITLNPDQNRTAGMIQDEAASLPANRAQESIGGITRRSEAMAGRGTEVVN